VLGTPVDYTNLAGLGTPGDLPGLPGGTSVAETQLAGSRLAELRLLPEPVVEAGDSGFVAGWPASSRILASKKFFIVFYSDLLFLCTPGGYRTTQ
jgi:hypothetical protein